MIKSHLKWSATYLGQGVRRSTGDMATASRRCLTSASRCTHILTRALGSGEGGELLRAGRVDAYGGIKVLLGGPQTHGHTVTLGNLSSIGAQHMEA